MADEIVQEPVNPVSEYYKSILPVDNVVDDATLAEPVAPPDVAKPEDAKPLENKEAEPQKEPAAPVVPPEAVADWRKSITEQKLDEVLEAAGLDKEIIAMVNYRKTNGDMTAYLNAIKNDYDKMQPEEILRLRTFAEEGLDDDDKAALHQGEMDRYKQDPALYSEEEIKLGKIQMKRDAIAPRALLKAEQAKFLTTASDPMAAHNAEADAAGVKRTADRKIYTDNLDANDFIKKSLESKKMALGKGKDAYAMEVADPQQFVDMLTGKSDTGKFLNNADGTPNYEKQYRTMHFLSNMDAYDKALIEHGKNLGGIAHVAPLENLQPFGIQPNNKTPSTMTDAQLAAKFAKPARTQ